MKPVLRASSTFVSGFLIVSSIIAVAGTLLPHRIGFNSLQWLNVRSSFHPTKISGAVCFQHLQPIGVQHLRQADYQGLSACASTSGLEHSGQSTPTAQSSKSLFPAGFGT
jgi:hypothetical protein